MQPLKEAKMFRWYSAYLLTILIVYDPSFLVQADETNNIKSQNFSEIISFHRKQASQHDKQESEKNALDFLMSIGIIPKTTQSTQKMSKRSIQKEMNDDNLIKGML